ncbi:MAG: S6e family ribosomal protein, partial [Nitrososphaerota archaeon]
MSKKETTGPRLVLSDPSTGKAQTIVLTPQLFSIFRGKKIGDEIDASALGLGQGKVRITGGTDNSGFPMRSDVSGSRLVSILLTKSTGFKARRKPPSKRKKRRNRRSVRGLRKRVTIRGNVISDST